MTAAEPIPAIHAWPTNAHLIEHVAQLGYLTDRPTLDVTYRYGTWWKRWRPAELTGCDIDPAYSPIGYSVDFTRLPWRDGEWAQVIFDPPYKLNGTATHDVDDRFGVAGAYTSRLDRHELMLAGLVECARVLAPGGILLAKSQAQVNGGRIWWQPDMLTRRGEECGLEKIDEFHMVGGRPQPADRTRLGCPLCQARLSKVKAGRRCREHGIVDPLDVPVVQEHASRNYSTLIVLRRPTGRRAQRVGLLWAAELGGSVGRAPGAGVCP